MMREPTEVTRRFTVPFVLLSVGLVCGGSFFFLWVAGQGSDSAFGKLDQQLLLALRNPDDPADPIGPLWLEEAIRDVTALGGIVVLVIFSVIAALYFCLAGRSRSALLLSAAVISGSGASSALKATYDRPRPDVVPHRMHVFTRSFPSGHAMMSSVAYLTAGALFARRQQQAVKIFSMCVTVLIVAAIGASRVYLGVHWPSDVLGGWTAGAIWALCFLLLANWWEPK